MFTHRLFVDIVSAFLKLRYCILFHIHRILVHGIIVEHAVVHEFRITSKFR